MELRDYLEVVRRRWVWIVACALLFTMAAFALTLAQTKQYSSSARLFVTTTSDIDTSIYQGGQFSQQRVQSYADLVSSRELASQVVKELGLSLTSDELAREVSARATLNTVNLTITATDPSPHTAQSIAQQYAQDLTDLIRQLETPPGQTAAPIKATIVDSASLPTSPSSPKPVRNTGLGLILGLLVGVGLAVLRQALDTRINSVEDLHEVSDVPVLGAIAYDSATAKNPLISNVASHAPRAESFRVLRTNLQFVDVDQKQKVFVITSAIPEEGKTTTSVNLAISLAQAGMKTLLVEGDLRRPKSGRQLGLDAAVGVTTVLLGRVTVEDAIQHHEGSGLDFLASGATPPNPAELLQSKSMADLMGRLRERYDIVIIDAPPLLPVTDAALLSAHADGALIVIRHGKVTKEQVRHSIERLHQVDASVVGIVLNMVPVRGRGYGYGYGYGYAPGNNVIGESK